MPAKSQQQQKFMGMVHALNKGDIKPSDVSKSVRDVAKTIKKSDAKDFASTKHNKIPRKVKQEILNKLKELNESVKKSDYISGLKDLQKVVKSEKGPFKGNNGGKIAKNYYEKALKMGMDNKFIDNLTRKRINSYNKKAFGLSGGSLHNAVVGGIDLLLKNINEYANKMGRDNLGGDDYTSKRKGGLRDFDGYDNVDYNKDMPQDESVNEGFKSEYEGNDGIIWKKGKTRGGVTNFTPYYKGHNIDKGGHNFKTEKDLKDFIKDYILSNQLYRKYRNESVNEVTRGQIHKAAKKGSFPITIVVVKNGKVIHQELVKTPEAVPASFKVIEKKYKGATISIEDKTGKRLMEGPIDKIFGGIPYKTKGKQSFSTVNIPDDVKKRIIMRAKKLGKKAKPNMKGGVTVLEGMFSTIDQIRQDSKDVRDFVKNVFADRDFKDMKNDKEFLKYLKSIYESKGVPQNYMQGRTSDYHTALRGKNRDYSGGTNFKKNNHGHPDIEKDDEDQETNSLSVKQTKLKEEMGNLSSSERLELYKLYSKAMKAMPGSPNQKKIKILINKLRKKADLKPLPISEYGQRLDLSYIEDMEAKLKGTPEPKDAIDRHIDEYIGGSYEFTRGDNYGQNSVNEIGIFPISNYIRDMIPSNMINTVNRHNKEKFHAVIDDLIRTLNHFWKKNNIPYRVRKR